jgi:alkylation response protein AidB-like acyl-CoA dehydrogenase
MADLKSLKGVSEEDRRMIADAEALLGPEPSKLGWVKNLFWGRAREDLIFPYPTVSDEETARCDALLAKLDHYLRTEHPSIEIDQNEEIPRWVIERLFELGVLGMTIPQEFGGSGLGITSYNRVLERVGRHCGSTAVLVSAHQSIGCKAIMLFGTDEQKHKWLPELATKSLSAFCLSEPNVGCDAGGQETHCKLSDDGSYYILNGEKKWATSGALAGLFTVMAKQQMPDGKEKVTALVCTPDMPGIDIFQKNRSKCGIRGTWQARIRFRDVKVPRDHLLHLEGKGLNVALTCLDYGRCTLSAGMLGGAVRSFEQGTKWAQTRFQFLRPLADFELVQQKVARMSALTYAIDAVLYATTGMLDRGDEDIMLETALCKVFCSEMGWRVVNDCVQIMGGESYMVENEIERIFRDSRINLIVEGANDLMQSFVFAYGGKQLAEMMLGVQESVGWDADESFSENISRIRKNLAKPGMMKSAVPLAAELYGGIKPTPPTIHAVDPSLAQHARKLAERIRDHSHEFKLASKNFANKIVTRECVQARLSDSAMWLHAWACTLSKLDRDLRRNVRDIAYQRAHDAAIHFMDLADQEIEDCFKRLHENTDDTMAAAAKSAMQYCDTLPNSDYVIHEASPNAKGTGKALAQTGIRQFPGDNASGQD